LSYAFLADKQCEQAEPLLEALFTNNPPTADDILPLLLEWVYLETGKQKEAAALLRFNPTPAASGVAQRRSSIFCDCSISAAG
jgi:hypothetical protein